jgi:DtxR family Mn-dependent transcriptional regulator
MSTQAEENYLKAIFKLSGKEKKSVSTNAIAEDLLTKASSVSDMVKRLSEKSLINYKKYQGVSLTKEGHSLAVHIIRKHRLWEVFLVNHLNFKWDEVHDIAEQLEHIKSPELVLRLDVFLGHPNYDPHGDPIPNAKGEFPKTTAIPLSEVELKEKGKVVAVEMDEPSFLKYLDKLNISIGTQVEILELNDFDNSIDIKIDGVQRHISIDVAKNILISVS